MVHGKFWTLEKEKGQSLIIIYNLSKVSQVNIWTVNILLKIIKFYSSREREEVKMWIETCTNKNKNLLLRLPGFLRTVTLQRQPTYIQQYFCPFNTEDIPWDLLSH